MLHVSTAEEIEFLKQHKDVATLEATQHHLTLSADDYARLGTLIQMNPPVRESRHRDGIWYGVQQGIIDVLGSDHAPHTLTLPRIAIGHDRCSNHGSDYA